MEIKYKYTLDDFEVIRQNKLEGYNLENNYDDNKTFHVEEFEIYEKGNYFKIGDFFGLFKGTLYRGAPATTLKTIKEVNAWLEIETGTNPNITKTSLEVDRKD